MNSSISSGLILIVLGALLVIQFVQANPLESNAKQNNNNDDDERLSLFPNAPDCQADEYPAFGMLPYCEPTCSNPRPVCDKAFHILDHVPCFCKRGLVREEQSKKCISLEQCPKSQTSTQSNSARQN